MQDNGAKAGANYSIIANWSTRLSVEVKIRPGAKDGEKESANFMNILSHALKPGCCDVVKSTVAFPASYI